MVRLGIPWLVVRWLEAVAEKTPFHMGGIFIGNKEMHLRVDFV